MSDAAAPAPVAAKPKVAKKASKPKAAAKHPGFNVMITEAIVSLKERGGSSVAAIKKAVGAKHGKDLPANWDKILSMTLKRMVSSS